MIFEKIQPNKSKQMNKATQKASKETKEKPSQHDEVTKTVVKSEKHVNESKEKANVASKTLPSKDKKEESKKDEVHKEKTKKVKEEVIESEIPELQEEKKINPKTGKPYGQKRENLVLQLMNKSEPIEKKTDPRTKHNVRLYYHPKVHYIIIYSRTVKGRVIVESDWNVIKDAVEGLCDDFQAIKSPDAVQKEVTEMLEELVRGGKEAYDKVYALHKSEFKSKSKGKSEDKKGVKRGSRGKAKEDEKTDDQSIFTEKDFKKVMLENESSKLKDLRSNLALKIMLQKRRIEQIQGLTAEECFALAEKSFN
jgi:hypothetical protein